MFEGMRSGTRVLRQEHGDVTYCVTSMQREIGEYVIDHLVAMQRIDNPDNPLVAGAIPDSHIALAKKSMDASLVCHMGGLDRVLDECEAEAKGLLDEKDAKIAELQHENELRVKQVEIIRKAVVGLTNESDMYFHKAQNLHRQLIRENEKTERLTKQMMVWGGADMKAENKKLLDLLRVIRESKGLEKSHDRAIAGGRVNEAAWYCELIRRVNATLAQTWQTLQTCETCSGEACPDEPVTPCTNWIEKKPDDLCPDCGRRKAHSAFDIELGGCPKWYVTHDQTAIADCYNYNKPAQGGKEERK